MHLYFIQNKYVPHKNNSPPPQRTNSTPRGGGGTQQFGDLCPAPYYLHCDNRSVAYTLADCNRQE
jgi:hypothetical protein